MMLLKKRSIRSLTRACFKRRYFNSDSSLLYKINSLQQYILFKANSCSLKQIQSVDVLFEMLHTFKVSSQVNFIFALRFRFVLKQYLYVLFERSTYEHMIVEYMTKEFFSKVELKCKTFQFTLKKNSFWYQNMRDLVK